MKRFNKLSRRSAAAVAAAIAALVFVSGNLLSVLTDSIHVEPAVLVDNQQGITPNDLRPAQCVSAAVSVNHVTSGGVHMVGVSGGDLMLASSSTADVTGGSDSDCIVSGSALTVDGGGGTNDVCLVAQAATVSNCEIVERIS